MRILTHSLCLAACALAVGRLYAGGQGNPPTELAVTYSLPGVIDEKPAPVSEPFSFGITAPSNLPAGSYSVSLAITFVGATDPNSGQPVDLAGTNPSSYVSVSPSPVQFTAAGQIQTVNVSAIFPAGTIPANYYYTIATVWSGIPSGYTIVQTPVYIDMTIAAPNAQQSPPKVQITAPTDLSSYTYTAGGSPLAIPFSVTATTGPKDPQITAIDADVNGIEVLNSDPSAPLGTITGLGAAGSTQVNGSGVITFPGTIDVPATYTLTVRASNGVNPTSTTSVDFTVTVLATAPTVTGISPANGASYIYVQGASPLSIPISCTATSSYGGIEGVTATIAGSAGGASDVGSFNLTPLAGNSLGVTATTVTSVQISAGDTYTLAITAKDTLGQTFTANSQFTVTEVPPPSVGIVVNGGNPVIWPAGTATTALSVPVQFNVTAGSGNVTAVNVTLSSGTTKTTWAEPVSGNSGTATINDTLSVSAPGAYTVTVAATDANATTTQSTTFAVTQGVQPTLSISQPANASSLVWPLGTSTLSVPFAFSAAAGTGNITNATVTLNGVQVANAAPGTPTLGYSGSLAIAAAGVYTVQVTVTDSAGSQNIATSQFSLVQPTPPVIGFSQLTNGATFTRQAGSPPTAIPFGIAVTENTIDTVATVSATLNGNAVTLGSLTGIGTSQASGSGTLQISAAGSYTLAVNATTTGNAQGSGSLTFSVKEVTSNPPPARSLLWLPPVVLGKTFESGSTVPIAFTLLDGNGKFVRDQTIVIAISRDGGIPSLFTYGRANDHNDRTYSIQGFAYRLNYDTARGKHTYRIDVYNFWPVGSNNPNLLGTKIISTAQGGCNGKNGGSNHNGDDDDDRHGDGPGNGHH
jgi:hypothetical protein